MKPSSHCLLGWFWGSTVKINKQISNNSIIESKFLNYGTVPIISSDTYKTPSFGEQKTYHSPQVTQENLHTSIPVQTGKSHLSVAVVKSTWQWADVPLNRGKPGTWDDSFIFSTMPPLPSSDALTSFQTFPFLTSFIIVSFPQDLFWQLMATCNFEVRSLMLYFQKKIG